MGLRPSGHARLLCRRRRLKGEAGTGPDNGTEPGMLGEQEGEQCGCTPGPRVPGRIGRGVAEVPDGTGQVAGAW